MMNVEKVLLETGDLGVPLNAVNNRLRSGGGAGTSTLELETQIRAHEDSTIFSLGELNREGEKLEFIPIASRTQVIPLSFSQHCLWLHDQLDRTAGMAYQIPAILRLHGRLDHKALRAALDRIVARHESLRTTFASDDGQTAQVIAPPDCGFALALYDLSELDFDEHAAAVERISKEEATQAFDLACGPLIRGRLLRLKQDEHVLLLTHHHMMSDSWSVAILVQELSTLYEAFCQDLPDPLPPLPIQYADYAVWQRDWLQGERLRKQAEYWKQRLRGAPALLELPTDRPRPAQRELNGATVLLSFDAVLSAGLKAFSRRHGVTLPIILLASWAALLSRLSGQDDVVIGARVPGRPCFKLEPLIGFFVNTLPLRLAVGQACTVAQLIECVKDQMLAAQAHQDVPLEQIVDLVQPPRSMAHTPLFQVLFGWQNAAADEVALPGLTLSRMGLKGTTAKFDLSLTLKEDKGYIVGSLEYATALFDRATVERHLGHWRTLLTAMMRDTALEVTRLPLLTEAEREQILVGWNDTDAPYEHDRCLHELFEAQVARNPSAVALVFEGRVLDYATVNRQANRLAHHLRAAGIGPDKLVGICAERGVEMVVAMLATLKAGGAYLPLDPTYPAERLAYMLHDAAPLVLLADAEGLVLLDESAASARVVKLEGKWLDQPEHNPSRAEVGLTPDHLAYVIYTSGSTGQPKGVMLTHRGLPNMVQAQIDALDVTPCSRILQFAAFGFDACTFECVMALCTGASLHLARQATLRDPDALERLIEEQNISHATVPPALLAALPEHIGLERLRTMIVAGEAPSPAVIRRWSRGRKLVNAYGPTETTVWASAWACPAEAHGSAPIGRPIANTQIYLLDAHRQPVPIGVASELYIGGAGVARGYLNRPDLTTERFIPNPFSTDPMARLYKTGDLARYLPNGDIEYLGRNDFQVKIRGFRIELGEIEAKLTSCTGVRDVVVVAREDIPGDQRLVAYLVLENEQVVQPGPLKAQLLQDLPEYMVPTAFIQMDKLPLTSNGKLDRKALLAPNQSSTTADHYEASQSATQRTLVRIWANILCCPADQISVNANFFAMGGHSLSAIKLKVAIAKAFEKEVILADIFLRPKLNELADYIDSSTRLEKEFIPEVENREYYPASFKQKMDWLNNQVAQACGYESFNCQLQLDVKSIEQDVLSQAIQYIVNRHEIMRTEILVVDNQLMQKVHDSIPTPIALKVFDLTATEGLQEELKHIAHQEQMQRFEFDKFPLFSFSLVKTREFDRVLLTIDHICGDQHFFNTLLDELRRVHMHLLERTEPSLETIELNYKSYAVWEYDQLHGEAGQHHRQYWRNLLEDYHFDCLTRSFSDFSPAYSFSYKESVATQLKQIPVVMSPYYYQEVMGVALNPYKNVFADRYRFHIDFETYRTLQSECKKNHCMMSSLIIASFAVWMHKLSCQNQVLMGLLSSARTNKDLEDVPGCFINDTFILTTINEKASIGQIVKDSQRHLAESSQHNIYPMVKVLSELDVSTDALGSIFLNYIATDALKSIADFEPYHLKGGFPQMDINFSIWEFKNTITIECHYRNDIFKPETIEVVMQYFQDILNRFSMGFSIRIMDVPNHPMYPKQSQGHSTSSH